MAGIMQVPKAPPVQAVAPPPLPDPSADEAAMRLEAMDRRRRGRAGTVQTSERGLVSVNANAPQKKTLLGE